MKAISEMSYAELLSAHRFATRRWMSNMTDANWKRVKELDDEIEKRNRFLG